MDHDAVDGFKQRQFDEILPLDEAAGRRRRRDHEQRVAGIGIDQPVQQAGIGQRHADIGERGIGDVAQHHQRQRRRLHAVGKCQRPVDAAGAAVAFKRRHLRTVETDADRLALFQRQPADVADDGAALGADRLDIDRLGAVEHQPHRIGAAEHRRGRRRGKGEGHAQAVAVAPRIDGGRGRLGFFRGCRRGRDLLRRCGFGASATGAWVAGRRRGFRGFTGAAFQVRQPSLPARRARRGACAGLRRRRRLLGRRRRLLGSGCRLLGGAAFSRRWRRLLGRRLAPAGRDLDPGLLGNRLRRDRRQLRRLLQRHRVVQRLAMRDLNAAIWRRPSTWPAPAHARPPARVLRRRLFRLLEGDVDDVVLLLAEGMDVDFADQRDIDRRGVGIGALGDRGDIRRRRHLGVRQIERQHAVELQRQLLFVEDRRNVDPVGHFEDEADEGRLHRGAHAHRRLLLCGRDRELGAKRALGGARARRQFANDFGRQRGRRAGPAIGQEIDEYPLAGGHGVDAHPALQRQPDRRAVGIAPRRADIIRHRVRQLVDGNIHRALEADDDDRARGGDLGFDVLGELQHQPRITAGRRERRLALDRDHRPGRDACKHQAARTSRQQAARPTKATPGRPRQCAALRPVPAAAVRPIQRLSVQQRFCRRRDALSTHSNLELAI